MLSHSSSFADVVAYIIGIINLIVPVLGGLALVIFLWSAVRYVLNASKSEGRGPERAALLWGLIALFVLFSVWGILRIVCSTLVGSSDCQGGAFNEPANKPLNIIPPGGR